MSLYPTVSAKAIVAKAYADLNVQDTRRWQVYMEWIAEALEHIGAFSQYVQKQTDIVISNYRGTVPCDLVNVVTVTHSGVPLNYGLSTHDYSNQNPSRKSQLSYTIEYPYINTYFKEGTLNMIYHAVPTDEEGYPLIPDRISLKEACFRYIVYKESFPKVLSGQMPEGLYRGLERDWQRYCGQARGDLNMPNSDKMNSIKENWLRLVPNINSDHSFHATDNLGERIKTYSVT